MTLLFSFVARGSVVLAEHASCSGNFTQVAFECLTKLSGKDTRFTYKAGEYLLNFVVDGGTTYLVVCEEGYPREICFYFLEQVQKEFKIKFEDKSKTASSHAFDRSFGPRLKHYMQYCANNPADISKMHRLKKDVDEVKGIMVQNIEKVMDRGDKIDVLVDKGDELKSQANRFQKHSKSVHTHMWRQNFKIKLLFATGIFMIAFIIFCLACFGGNGNCLKKKQ